MASFERPRTEERTRLAVVADPHVATEAEGTSKLFEHTREHLAAAVADINGRDVDCTVSVGDLTKDGEPWNYDAVDAVLADLETPFLSVPGNHDVPKERDDHDAMSVEAFAERYADGDLPFHREVGGVDLIGLNSAGDADTLYDSHDGVITDEDLAWLDDTLATADTPVVVTHHNFPSMTAQLEAYRDAAEPEMFIPPVLQDAEAFVDVLNAHDVPLMFTGHLHLPSVAREGDTWEVMSPTTCSFPQAYLLVEIGPEGTTVEMVPVVDVEGMTRGYSERLTDSVTARGLTGIAATRLALFPLVDQLG